MRLSLALLFLLLIGCSSYSPVNFSSESYSLYSYYLQEKQFQYTYSGPVNHIDSIPPLSLTVGDQWSYQYWENSLYDSTVQKVVVTLLSLEGSRAEFLVNAHRKTVFLEKHYYIGWEVASMTLDTSLAPFPLPIPHKSQLLSPYESPCLIMADGSFAYKVDDGCYSSVFGLILSKSCPFSFNGSSHDLIAIQLNEFRRREQLWFR